MLDQDKILNFLKTTGPTLPAKVAKNIGTEIFIASAHLSFLVSQGKVLISNLKIGGSPLYYLSGQEPQLYPFAAGNVNPKELRVLDRLKEEKVLREGELDLLSKVALRSLKDFATPLHVTIKGRRELFWRWYLLPPDQTKQAIGDLLRASLQPEEVVKKEEAPLEAITTGGILVENKPESFEKKQDKNNLLESKEGIEKEKILEQEPLPILNEKLKVEAQKVLSVESNSKVEKVDNEEKDKELNLKKIEKEIIKEEKIKKPRKKRMTSEDSLLPSVREHLKKLEITMGDVEIVRKNSELNLDVHVPSIVGKMKYFCKAKKKHRVDEKDVSAAYMEAQIKKLPLLFLYSNQITKKAEDMLKTDAFSNAVVKKIDL